MCIVLFYAKWGFAPLFAYEFMRPPSGSMVDLMWLCYKHGTPMESCEICSKLFKEILLYSLRIYLHCGVFQAIAKQFKYNASAIDGASSGIGFIFFCKRYHHCIALIA
ncbi:MAG: hypothetical protein RL660_2682 [Bacteroidota bacterium]